MTAREQTEDHESGGSGPALVLSEEKTPSSTNAVMAAAPSHGYLSAPVNSVSTSSAAVLKKQSVDSCDDPLSQWTNITALSKDDIAPNTHSQCSTSGLGDKTEKSYLATAATNTAPPISPSYEVNYCQDSPTSHIMYSHSSNSYEQKNDSSNLAKLPSSLASKFSFLANMAASTIQDAVQNATKGQIYNYSNNGSLTQQGGAEPHFPSLTQSTSTGSADGTDGIYRSSSFSSTSGSISSSKTANRSTNLQSSSLKGNTSTTSIVSMPEMDHEKKNAVFSSALGSSTLLPGERIIMFLSHLSFVRDSSSPRTGVGYSPTWMYEPLATSSSSDTQPLDHKHTKDMVWCCAMTLYRLILFQYFESDFSDADEHTIPSNTFQDTPDVSSSTQELDKKRRHVVVQMPLASIDRLERTALDISNGNQASLGHGTTVSPFHNFSSSPTTHIPYPHGGTILCLTVHGKDNGRFIRFATTSHLDTMRAYEALNTYAFPGRRNIGYLFAFESRREEVLSSVQKTMASISVDDTDSSRVSEDSKITTLATTKWFDPWIEFQRMGIVPPSQMQVKDDRPRSCPWKFYSTINTTYELSPSYPSILIGPASINDESVDGSSFLYKVASFRSEGRIPALTWCSRLDGASIWRSSQPKVGLQGNRNLADETFLKMIAEGAAAAKLIANSGGSKVLKPSMMYLKMLTGGINDSEFFLEKGANCLLRILDLRPKSSAMANRTAGYGYENTSNYFNTTITFHGIGNIHAVRDSYNKLSTLCMNPSVNDLYWSQLLEETKWLQFVRLILAASWQVAFHVLFNRLPVLVHCSHGWDRTSQVTCIAQILLDPFYRTRKGFSCLIEKDFLSFGHPFHTRCGHGEGRAERGSVGNTSGYDTGPGVSDEAQISPIFIQFLDCVFQLVNQCPNDFEFNTNYLLVLSDHVYSCRFGTLLCDTEKERETVASIRKRTFCLWEYVNSDMSLLNPSYELRATDSLVREVMNEYEAALMIPLPSLLRNVVLWSARHCMHGPKASDTKRWPPST